MLESMLYMAHTWEIYHECNSSLTDNQVIHFLTIEDKNPFSVKSYVDLVRENARGIRNNITTELWETINRFYHTTKAFNRESLEKKGPYDFCKTAMEFTTIIKGVADDTLLHNEAWSMIKIGIHLERAIQVTQITLSKLNDIKATENSLMSQAINSYHWAALLRSAGGLDVSRNFYGGVPPSRERAISFLVLNNKFPKSVLFNLQKLKTDLNVISNNKPITPDCVEFTIGKLTAKMNYCTLDEILDNEEEFVLALQENLIEIGVQLEKQYLTY
ncbi:hypothetical protein D770_07305 [Flammeovirgaceae bacterium 311]|nr:hypothetical protein D770_07305 [Flammeovirgaceae bacterium 311]